MVAQNIAFGVIAAVMIASAIKVVTTKNVVHAALFLVLVLAGAAAQFILLAAEFIAVTQVLIYIGAVVVLFLFSIMLTRAAIDDDTRVDHANKVPAVVVALLLLVVMVYSLVDYYRDAELPDDTRTTTAQVSDSIFGDYIVPFEATSVLLLAALIGAIVLARKE